jgi:hypothetical protein
MIITICRNCDRSRKVGLCSNRYTFSCNGDCHSCCKHTPNRRDYVLLHCGLLDERMKERPHSGQRGHYQQSFADWSTLQLAPRRPWRVLESRSRRRRKSQPIYGARERASNSGRSKRFPIARRRRRGTENPLSRAKLAVVSIAGFVVS